MYHYMRNEPYIICIRSYILNCYDIIQFHTHQPIISNGKILTWLMNLFIPYYVTFTPILYIVYYLVRIHLFRILKYSLNIKNKELKLLKLKRQLLNNYRVLWLMIFLLMIL